LSKPLFLSALLLCCTASYGNEVASYDDESSPLKDRIEILGGNGPRVAAYLRVSTGRQAKEGSSLPAQQEQLDRLKRKLNPSRIHRFVDAGKSGVDFDKLKTKSIMRLVEQKEIDELWVTQIDRIGRECAELLLFFLALRKEGVTVRTPDKTYSLKDLSSLLMVVIEAWGAEEENKRRAKSAMASKRQRFRERKWNKPSIPLGYRRKGEWLEKDPMWEPLVRETYDLFLNFRNFRAVSEHLCWKHRSSLAEPITRYHVRSILSDPTYVGKPHHLGEAVHDPSLSWVDEERFTKVQEIMIQIHSRHVPNRTDPVKGLVAACGISALQFLDQLEFRHRMCGGLTVRNGTTLVAGRRSQTYLCRGCGRQWVIPNDAQLQRIREFFFGDDSSSCNLSPQQTRDSIYPLVQSYPSKNLEESSKSRRHKTKTKAREAKVDRSKCLEEFLENTSESGP